MLPGALWLWARERGRAGIQGGRRHHPDQSDRRQLVRRHDPRPVGLLPNQLCGYPGAAASLGPPASDLTPSRLPLPDQYKTPGKTACICIKMTNHALLLLLLCFCAILLSQKQTETSVTRRGFLAWGVQKGGGQRRFRAWRSVGQGGLDLDEASGERHGVSVRACLCLFVRFWPVLTLLWSSQHTFLLKGESDRSSVGLSSSFLHFLAALLSFLTLTCLLVLFLWLLSLVS